MPKSTQIRFDKRDTRVWVKESGDKIIDEIFEAYRSVQRQAQRRYLVHTSDLGRISKFLHTQRDKKNLRLLMEVSAQEGVRKGADLGGRSASDWNAIAYQAEFGRRFRGQQVMRPSNAKVISIPINPKAREKSPRSFRGFWIKGTSGLLYFIESASKGRTGAELQEGVKRRRRRRKKVGRAPRSRGTTDQNILYIGVERRKIMRARHFWAKTINDVEGSFRTVMAKRLNKTFRVVRG